MYGQPEMKNWHAGKCGLCGEACKDCVCYPNKNKKNWHHGKCGLCRQPCRACVCH